MILSIFCLFTWKFAQGGFGAVKKLKITEALVKVGVQLKDQYVQHLYKSKRDYNISWEEIRRFKPKVDWI